MLKILQGRLQQYVDDNSQKSKLDFEGAEELETKLLTCTGLWGKQKNTYFCFIDYAKAFGCMNHSNLGQILKEMGVPDHLIYLLSNLYVG